MQNTGAAQPPAVGGFTEADILSFEAWKASRKTSWQRFGSMIDSFYVLGEEEQYALYRTAARLVRCGMTEEERAYFAKTGDPIPGQGLDKVQELKQLIGLMVEKFDSERLLRDVYRYVNELYCRN